MYNIKTYIYICICNIYYNRKQIYIITSIRLQAQQAFWSCNHWKTLRLSTNPVETAAPDALGARISISDATGCSNRLRKSH